MDATCEHEETTHKQKSLACQVPCVTLCLLQPTQGQRRKVHLWGNADRGSPAVSLHHTSLLCPSGFGTGQMAESWLTTQLRSLPLLFAGHWKKAITMTFAPASPHQNFKSKREYTKLSCSPDDARMQPKG